MRAVVRQAGQLIGGAALSKALGFVREVEMARVLGAGIIADTFRGAMTAVLLPVGPVIGEALAVGVIPLHGKWRREGRAPESTAALVVVITLMFVGVAVALYLFAVPWAGLLLAGFGPDAMAFTIRFIEIMAMGIPCMVIACVLAAVEVSCGRSRLMVLRGTSQNIGIMLGIMFFAWRGDASAIAWGFTVSNGLVAAYGLVWHCRQGGLNFRGIRPSRMLEVTVELLRPIRPLLTIPFAEQGNYIAERLLASAAVVGTLASLEYARTLTECALYLFSQPIGYVILAKAGISGVTGQQYRARQIVRPTLAIMLPASIFLVIFASDIVRVVFQRGSFQEQAVALTAGALAGIALGLWATTLGLLLIRILNTVGRNGLAALIIISSFGCNVVANLYLAPEFGTFGLGAAEAIRGLAVLLGVVLALQCGHLLMREIALALPAVVLLALAGQAVVQLFDGSVSRLLAGFTLFLPAVLVWSAVAMPEQFRLLTARLMQLIGTRS